MNTYRLASELGYSTAKNNFAVEYRYRLYHEMRECHEVVFQGSARQRGGERKQQNQSPQKGGSRHRNGNGNSIQSRTAEIAGGISTSGVNALSIEACVGEKRWMISGHVDSSIKLWDLASPSFGANADDIGNEDFDRNDSQKAKFLFRPVTSLHRSQTHKYAITSLQFFPFDSGLFTSASYDGVFKVWDSSLLVAAASVDVGSQIWTHGFCEVISEQSCLVALGGKGNAVRLVDLRSGGFTHSLISSFGAGAKVETAVGGIVNNHVHSVRWHPVLGSILAVGHSDGTIKLWDLRFSATSPFASLDYTNADCSSPSCFSDPVTNINQVSLKSTSATILSSSNRAHSSPVIGLSFTSPGTHLLSLSSARENKLRLWDMNTGRNTLANYGPWIRRAPAVQNINPVLISQRYCEKEIAFVPSDGLDGGEVLGFDLFTGKVIRRMKIGAAGGNIRCLIERPGYVELYSGGQDGVIRKWGVGREFGEDEKRKKEEAMSEKKKDILKRIDEKMKKRPVTFP